MTKKKSWNERLVESANYKWWVLAVVQFGILFVGMGATTVNLAIPTISQTFDVPFSLSQWIIVIYALTMAIALPIGGKIPDYFGRKNVVIGGFLLFSLSSVFCAMAPSIEILLFSQVFLALGSAALLANSNVITFFVFPKEQHGLAMGINGTVASIGYGLGLLLGGYLVNDFGWSSIYWLNLPFGIIAVILSFIVLAEAKISGIKHPRSSFDFLGCILFAIFMGSLMLSLSSKILYYERLLFIIVGVIGLGLFILREKTTSKPIFDLNLFKIHSFSAGTFLRLLITFIYSSCLFLIPIYTQKYLHFNPLESGIAMVPFSLALFFLGPLGGKLSDKIGSRWITAVGFLACTLALIIFSDLDGGSVVKIYIGMFLLGGGIGFFVPSNNSTTLRAIPLLHVGFVSGFLWSMAYIGTAIGTGVSSLLLASAKERFPGDLFAIVIGQKETFHILIPFGILGIILCLLRPGKRFKMTSKK